MKILLIGFIMTFALNLYAAQFPEEQKLLNSVPAGYRPYAKILQLKNLKTPVPTSDGTIAYKKIYVIALAVQKHVLISFNNKNLYADDAVDADGNNYYLHLVYMNQGLKSYISTSQNSLIVPEQKLSSDSKEISYDTLFDLAKDCHLNSDTGVSYQNLISLVSSNCIEQIVTKYER